MPPRPPSPDLGRETRLLFVRHEDYDGSALTAAGAARARATGAILAERGIVVGWAASSPQWRCIQTVQLLLEAADRGRRALHFRPADLGRTVDDLALQVRERDRVIVDDAERPDAGGGQIEQRRRAQPAGADDQHSRALERLLPRPADLAQDDVAGVAFKLLRTEH